MRSTLPRIMRCHICRETRNCIKKKIQTQKAALAIAKDATHNARNTKKPTRTLGTPTSEKTNAPLQKNNTTPHYQRFKRTRQDRNPRHEANQIDATTANRTTNRSPDVDEHNATRTTPTKIKRNQHQHVNQE